MQPLKFLKPFKLTDLLGNSLQMLLHGPMQKKSRILFSENVVIG